MKISFIFLNVNNILECGVVGCGLIKACDESVVDWTRHARGRYFLTHIILHFILAPFYLWPDTPNIQNEMFSRVCSCYFHTSSSWGWWWWWLMKIADVSMNLLLSASWQSSIWRPPTVGQPPTHHKTDENIEGSVNWVWCQMMMNGDFNQRDYNDNT